MMRTISVRVLSLLALSILPLQAQSSPPSEAREDSYQRAETAQAVSGDDGESLHDRWSEFGVLAGAGASQGHIWGEVPDLHTQFFALRYGRRWRNFRYLALEYIVDVYPFRRFSYPTYVAVRQGKRTFMVRKTTQRSASTGFGVVPLGMQFNFPRWRRVQPFFSSSLGIIVFPEPIPTKFGRRLNFTIDFFGCGVQFFTRTHYTVSVGYKYTHMSNANRGIKNPSFETQYLFLGFSFLKGKSHGR